MIAIFCILIIILLCYNYVFTNGIPDIDECTIIVFILAIPIVWLIASYVYYLDLCQINYQETKAQVYHIEDGPDMIYYKGNLINLNQKYDKRFNQDSIYIVEYPQWSKLNWFPSDLEVNNNSKIR